MDFCDVSWILDEESVRRMSEVRTPGAVVVSECGKGLVGGVEERVLVVASWVFVFEDSGVDQTVAGSV